MATRKKEVATAKVGAVARPSFMKDDSSRGNESVTSKDMAIPRISIIQDLSPQHKKTKPEYIEGAEPRMLFNTATGTLYGHDILAVPVLFRVEWILWKDIDSGGGFLGSYSTEAEAAAAKSELPEDEQRNVEVVDTAQHFILIVGEDGESLEQAVISMSKSQMKVSRKWNTMITSAGGDRFERIYKMEVVEDQNKQGQEYYNWKPTQLGYVTEDMYKTAERMYDAVKSGAMDVKRDDTSPQTSAPEQGDTEDDEEF